MRLIFDKIKVKLDRDKAANFAGNNFLREHAAKIILNWLEMFEIKSGKILELGAFTGHLSRHLEGFDLTVSDISEEALKINPCKNQIIGDEEDLEFDGYDVILSSLNLHWINFVQDFLAKVYKALKPSGRFIANFIGEDSLKSLRSELTKLEIQTNSLSMPHVSPFITKQDITSLMQMAGFKDIITDSGLLEVTYPKILSAMKDLKKMGESNKIISSMGQGLALKVYKELLKDNAKFTTEFTIITVHGKKV
ncbi:hypothetical protein phytr_2650 [Candidatus Phycorickettsia trachydisci]|uniref:Uncharacterized protein n=1 Tax=Candidatus Phycorickettsia trachydisci TaxID=2115978 RepID=A0A2P1P7H4_9RICK|nr:methyltransferase domain-containing protein [Candidatus Phycorickettsia trachydisci]AVP87221.1 hypothetical protein phytr_2650 [Candidatus Phycorickettsia trachydisci]